MEWDYSGRKERDGEKKKIVKATEKRENKKSKRQGSEGTRGKGVPQPHAGLRKMDRTNKM